MVAIDQFGTALFNRWRSRYREGLARLEREGIVYDAAFQSHGLTDTCPGHSTLLTGKTPAHTGIVGNEWYDTDGGRSVYCVADARYSDALDPARAGVGPAHLVASTLGDWLKQASPRSRVIAVTGKDRSAITLGGHRSDGSFWYLDNVGFTTYVAEGDDGAAKLAALAALNERIRREPVHASAWTYVYDECRAYEGSYRIGGIDWESRLPPVLPSAPGEAPRKARAVHTIDSLTLEAALALIDHHRLGQRGVTDLLAIGFSATDFVGHAYGTQGPEMCEQMYRLDALIGRLLARLETLGTDVVLVLSGDHGGSDFPERLAQQGFRYARRVDGFAWLRSVNDELKARFALADDPLASPDLAQFYAVGAAGRALAEPLRSQVIAAALEVLRARPEVAAAFELPELLANHPKGVSPEEMTLRERFAQNAMTGRSGDILVAYRPGITMFAPYFGDFIATHAGPWDLDRRVPIVFWWPNAPAQTRMMPVSTTDIAPTLASLIGIEAPPDLDGQCLELGEAGAPICPQR